MVWYWIFKSDDFSETSQVLVSEGAIYQHILYINTRVGGLCALHFLVESHCLLLSFAFSLSIEHVVN